MKNIENFPEDRFTVFEKITRQEFSFLEKQFGFKLLSVERIEGKYISIRYQSKQVFVNVHYGSPGYQLEFRFGRLGIEDLPGVHSFVSGDLLYLGCKKWSNYSLYSAYSYDNLRECLPKLASLLYECGQSCLRGENVAYEKMIAEGEKDYKRWIDSNELLQIKQVAEDAWLKKDYGKVVRLFDPIKHKLTAVEHKKFEYAKKRS